MPHKEDYSISQREVAEASRLLDIDKEYSMGQNSAEGYEFGGISTNCSTYRCSSDMS